MSSAPVLWWSFGGVSHHIKSFSKSRVKSVADLRLGLVATCVSSPYSDGVSFLSQFPLVLPILSKDCGQKFSKDKVSNDHTKSGF